MSDQKIYTITPTTVSIDSFRIASVTIQFGQNQAIIAVDLFGDNSLVQTKYLTMSGNDYSSWQSDSPYVVDWVVAQLGVVLQ
jgi:hypothetical protein